MKSNVVPSGIRTDCFGKSTLFIGKLSKYIYMYIIHLYLIVFQWHFQRNLNPIVGYWNPTDIPISEVPEVAIKTWFAWISTIDRWFHVTMWSAKYVTPGCLISDWETENRVTSTTKYVFFFFHGTWATWPLYRQARKKRRTYFLADVRQPPGGSVMDWMGLRSKMAWSSRIFLVLVRQSSTIPNFTIGGIKHSPVMGGRLLF